MVGLVLGCSRDPESESLTQGDVSTVWSELRRPIEIPRLAAGASCPVTPATTLSRAFAPAQGDGPLYPVGAAGGLQFIYPVQPGQTWYPSEWSGNKIAWTAPKTFRGRILIRGRQVDGPHILRFGEERLPMTEMRFMVTASDIGEDGWYQRGSTTRLRAPGCYAWQVDGRSFSYVVVFRAIRVAPD